MVPVIDDNHSDGRPQKFQGASAGSGIKVLAPDSQQEPLQQAVGKQHKNDLVDDHSFYRLEQQFRDRHGIIIARQQMVQWVEPIAALLRPLTEAMWKRMLAGGYLQVDETPVRVPDPDVEGKAARGYLWFYAVPGGDVVLDFSCSRGLESVRQRLKDFTGTIQTDAYEVYQSLERVTVQSAEPPRGYKHREERSQRLTAESPRRRRGRRGDRVGRTIQSQAGSASIRHIVFSALSACPRRLCGESGLAPPGADTFAAWG